MPSLLGEFETWATLTLVVAACFAGWTWLRLRASDTDDPAELHVLVVVLATAGYAVAALWLGFPGALGARVAHLPAGLATAATAVPVLVGVWSIFAAGDYVAISRDGDAQLPATSDAYAAATHAGWKTLSWVGWLAFGAVTVAQFGTVVGAVVAAASFVLLREWYAFRFLTRLDGHVRRPTGAEAAQVRSVLGDSLPDRVPIRVREVSADLHPADLTVDLVGLPGRRRFLVDEPLLDATDDPSALTVFALAAHQIDRHTWAAFTFARTARVAIALAALSVVTGTSPFAGPALSRLVRFGVLVVVCPVALALIEEFAWARVFAVDQTAAEDVGHERLVSVLEAYDGPPVDDRLEEFLHLHPSAPRRIAALSPGEAPDPTDAPEPEST